MIFSPVQIGRLEISNRIAVAPMCQYSAVDGVMTDWHTQHLMQLGYSAAGLIMICLLYTSPSPRDKRQSRMPSSA